MFLFLNMFKAPISLLSVGPSMCGKTTFITKLIKNPKNFIIGEIKKIYYCCPNLEFVPPEVEKIKNIKKIQGIPDINNIEENSLLILDDFMLKLGKEAAEIFTVSCHHKNISVVLTVQNIFHKNSPWLRDISLNAQQIIIFRSLRDLRQINYLFNQFCPDNTKNLLKLYKTATAKPYSYIIFNFSQKNGELSRITANHFNNNNVYESYVTDSVLKENTKKINKDVWETNI